MRLLRLVVHRRAGGVGDGVGAQRLCVRPGLRQHLLDHVQQITSVAIGHRHQGFARGGGHWQGPTGLRLDTGQQLPQRVGGEAMQHQHLTAGQQRGVQFEGRVFGRRTDQHNGPILDERQKAILLRPVEAVDFVDEQQRPLPDCAPFLGLVERLAQVGDAAEHGGERLKRQIGFFSEEAGNRRLTATRRPPQHYTGQGTSREHPAERTVGAEQMFLPDHLGQSPRTQPVGERPRRRLLQPCGLKQRTHARNSMRSRLPSRRRKMRQLFGWSRCTF